MIISLQLVNLYVIEAVISRNGLFIAVLVLNIKLPNYVVRSLIVFERVQLMIDFYMRTIEIYNFTYYIQIAVHS